MYGASIIRASSLELLFSSEQSFIGRRRYNNKMIRSIEFPVKKEVGLGSTRFIHISQWKIPAMSDVLTSDAGYFQKSVGFFEKKRSCKSLFFKDGLRRWFARGARNRLRNDLNSPTACAVSIRSQISHITETCL